MSLPDPPSFSQQHKSSKRKRTDHIPDGIPSSLPLSLNPLSHSPSTVAQFAIAGLSETDEDPSQRIRDFPHRGLTSAVEPETDEDPETEGDEAARPKPKRTTTPKRGGHFDALLQSVHCFLDQGAIEKASRAYGLLLQLRPSGHPVDIRHHDLWAIGAEILMREGEGPSEDQDEAESGPVKRWGRAANMSKVKAYFDTLIQQHPYDYRTPNVVSALDFCIALFSCEIYNAHTEHVLALNRLAHNVEQGPRRGSYGHDDSFGSDDTETDEVRAVQKRDELRLQSLSAMQDITKRMDMLMQDMPYSRNQHYLRLRAMASFYIADLVLPASSSSMLQTQEAQRARQTEQTRARDALEKIVTYGGELDEAALNVLKPSDDSEGDTSIPLYPTLPIRGL
ncbi:hypothetical protein F66182_2767 [Fusarium sp. NRRL 66182]|nr:hypothetical protein F66182_2767 [Fusarium sp. NRRL 66182]